MASITTHPNSTRTLQFVGADGKRRTIRLGKVTARIAQEVKLRVELLNVAKITGQAIDSETARWVAGLDAKMSEKLAAVGLIETRKRSRLTLAEFVDDYISGRTDIKPRTRINLQQVRRDLVAHFGESKLLSDITPGDADEWRVRLMERLGENSVRRHCGRAKQLFRAAIRKRLISENPFGDITGCSVRGNPERFYFISRDEADKVLQACPNAEWRLLFALSRFGGLRCPSEHLALKWEHVDWEHNRLTVPSPKTEHHDGKSFRVVPIFPELRQYLDDAFQLAAPGEVYVIARYRSTNANLRTQLQRIIRRAGLRPWPKLFHNLRATRQTELAQEFPIHVVCDWIGNSTAIAAEHYLRVTEADFDRATTSTTCSALQKAMQYTAVLPRTELQANDDAHEFARKNRTVRDGAVAQISPRGTELPQESSGNLQVVDLGDSLSDSHCGVSDPQLVRLVEVWPGLSGDTRDVIPCSRGL